MVITYDVKPDAIYIEFSGMILIAKENGNIYHTNNAPIDEEGFDMNLPLDTTDMVRAANLVASDVFGHLVDIYIGLCKNLEVKYKTDMKSLDAEMIEKHFEGIDLVKHGIKDIELVYGRLTYYVNGKHRMSGYPLSGILPKVYDQRSKKILDDYNTARMKITREFSEACDLLVK